MNDSSVRIDQKQRQDIVDLLDRVDALGEQTKELALNLALYLAKAKARKSSDKLTKLEPEFIRLVNSTVKVIQELTVVLKAARHEEKMLTSLRVDWLLPTTYRRSWSPLRSNVIVFSNLCSKLATCWPERSRPVGT